MSEKESYSVEIAGVPLRLTSPLSTSEVAEICRLVNEQVMENIKKSKGQSIQSAAIVTALNLAEELLAIKRQVLKMLDHVEGKLKSVSNQLQKTLSKKLPMDQ